VLKMPLADKSIIEDSERLEVLRDLALVNSDREPFFDYLTVLTSQVIGTPVSLVSMVASDFQFFKSSHGLGEPLYSERQTPLSHSFCQHVVATGEPLIVNDAREHELVKDNGALIDMNVIGYLGIPLHTGQNMLGSFCALEFEPREWTDDEVAIMQAFADLVNHEISARARAKKMSIPMEQHAQEAKNLLDNHIVHMNADTARKELLNELKIVAEKFIAMYATVTS